MYITALVISNHLILLPFQIVPPDGNTTFDVVFLARQEGNVENTLYIHTSLGSFKYQVMNQNYEYLIFSFNLIGNLLKNKSEMQ